MWAIITLLTGILLIVGTILAFIFGECKTPSHLRGYYGKSYGWGSLFGMSPNSMASELSMKRLTISSPI